MNAAFARADALRLRDHAPVRAFVFMANTAVDSDPHPSYFGGRDALAGALAVPHTESGYHAVKRAVTYLTRHGILSVASKGAPGRNTRYLLLDGEGGPLRPATGAAQRPVNNSEQGPLSDGTGAAQRPEQGTLSGPLRRKEEKEEETRASAPTRSCTRHTSWEHAERCRACGEDRRAAEALTAARRPATMSEVRGDCGTGRHRMLPDGTCMLCTYREAAA